MSTDQTNLGEFDDLETDVYVTSSISRGALVYHTDSECQFVTENHKLITLADAEQRGLNKCKTCSGEAEPNNQDISKEDQCGALTTKDQPCRMPALGGFERCSRHLDFGENKDTDVSADSSNDDVPVWKRQRDELLDK